MEKIKIKLDGGMMPKKATKGSAGFDVYCPDDIDIHTGRQLIDLGIILELPSNLCVNSRARSGYSLKGFEAVCVQSTGETEKRRIDADILLGLIDSDFRNRIGAILKVNEDLSFYKRVFIPKGERIAQLQFSYVPDVQLVQTENIDMSADRGGGFGHTGK